MITITIEMRMRAALLDFGALCPFGPRDLLGAYRRRVAEMQRKAGAR